MYLPWVCAIEQQDRYHFTLKWSDGRVFSYRLSTIQKRCPCMACVAKREKSGLKNEIEENVVADRMICVGKYALRIAFTSGCAHGIYPFSLLRKWGEEGSLS